MSFLTENVGLFVLLFSLIIIAGIVVLVVMQKKANDSIVAQRVNITNLMGKDFESGELFAKVMIGNRSLNDVALTEIGICNGKMSFNYTGLFKRKNGMAPLERISIHPRDMVKLELTVEEACKVIMTSAKNKLVVGKIKLYVIDTTGNVFKKTISNVRKLIMFKINNDKFEAKKAAGLEAKAAKEPTVHYNVNEPEEVKEPIVAPVADVVANPAPVKPEKKEKPAIKEDIKTEVEAEAAEPIAKEEATEKSDEKSDSDK